jgi:hypothetical protein
MGYEFSATSCPAEPPSDTKSYTYLITPINCVGNKITKFTSYGDISGTPASIISFYTSKGYRILRNPGGTHFLLIQNGTYPFTGSVVGLNMAGLPAGVYSTDSPEKLNQYCTQFSNPIDQDGDGYPDCLDCAATDPNSGYGCTAPCEKERQLYIEFCGGENNIINWNESQCAGMCKEQNFGPTCPIQ